MLKNIILVCFYLLFFVTPMLFSSLNHELFEYNKMMFVYILTIIISACWMIGMLNEKRLIFSRSILDLPLLLFLLANILSTVFSIDVHTSVWGYYTRSNGGLLSVAAYTLLFFAFTANVNLGNAIKLIKAALWGGFLVALYAIPEHFGLSPSCVLLYQQFSADCWIQDVQARVFATLGQPNWLGAYMAMLIPLAMAIAVIAKKSSHRLIYTIVAFCMYLAFTFTYSRGASIGMYASLVAFPIFALILSFWAVQRRKYPLLFDWGKRLIILILLFVGVTLVFGSSLWKFRLLSQVSAPIRPSVVKSSGTQLETGGTESGQIRLIVWRGAWEIFKKNPIFGSGVETFAYSYYLYRPREHNLVSEWDFLYNKAHNEYLNSLANTGIIGLGTLILVIGVFFYWIGKKAISTFFLTVKKRDNNLDFLIYFSIAASIISFLVQNIFGFSVVMVAMLFYLFMAVAFVYSQSLREVNTNKVLLRLFHSRAKLSKILRVSLITLIVILATNYIFLIVRYWWADTLFAKGSNLNDRGSVVAAYRELSRAASLNPGESLYRLEKAYAGAGIASGLVQEDATLAAELKEEADKELAEVLEHSPNNITYLRSAIRTYFELATLDPAYNQKTLDIFDRAIKLAPTDAKLLYNKGLVLGGLNRLDEALIALNVATGLKPNYREAYISKAAILLQQKKVNEAKLSLEEVLKIYPGDQEVTEKLDAIEKSK